MISIRPYYILIDWVWGNKTWLPQANLVLDWSISKKIFFSETTMPK
jgi:ammonia channel protein AmtB